MVWDPFRHPTRLPKTPEGMGGHPRLYLASGFRSSMRETAMRERVAATRVRE